MSSSRIELPDVDDPGGSLTLPEDDQGGLADLPDADLGSLADLPDADLGWLPDLPDATNLGGLPDLPDADQGWLPEDDQGGLLNLPEDDKGGLSDLPEDDQGWLPDLPEDDQGGLPDLPEDDQDGLWNLPESGLLDLSEDNMGEAGLLELPEAPSDNDMFEGEDDFIVLPPDIVLEARGSKRHKRRKPYPPHQKGASRKEVMNSTEMVPSRQSVLWEALPTPSAIFVVQDDVAEVYSPQRVLVETQRLGLRGDLSADILTGWDFRREDHRIAFMVRLKTQRPRVLILSPPCTMHSALMAMNWYYMPIDVRLALYREGLLHLEFCCLLIDYQVSQGFGYVYEHPASALSWQNRKMRRAMADPNSLLAIFEMCMFGLKSKVSRTPMKKTTKVLTNVPGVFRRLNGCMCQKQHEHQIIQNSEGGEKRSVWAQRYPQPFCQALAAGIHEYVHSL